MIKFCKFCDEILRGWQKNRTFCDWDCYQAWLYPLKHKIKQLQSELNWTTRNMDTWKRKAEQRNSRKWALLRLLGLEWLVE